MSRPLSFVFRGETVTPTAFRPTLTVLEWLREERRATGTKEGCNEGDCGACTVVLRRIVDGRPQAQPVNSCILLLAQLDGAELLTIEDLAAGGSLHPIQQAMVEHHGSQCGFCTPGIVMSLYALDATGRPATRRDVVDALAGNLCRCTGYRPIVAAALDALARPDRTEAPPSAALLALARETADMVVGEPDRFVAAPASVDALADLYLGHPDATLVAGATDVGLWVTKRLDDLRKIIWLGRCADLGRIEDDGTRIVIGAAASHAAARPALAAIDPDLDELMRRFGSEQVRASGTVGGNIANGSPVGDLAPALIALGATLRLRRGRETRTLPIEDFFLAYGRQDRRPGEFLTAVEVPKLVSGTAFRCIKISKRFDEDISSVMGAIAIGRDGTRVTAARLAFGGMAATPRRAVAAEVALVGSDLAEAATWKPALDALAADFTPIGDLRASADYRMDVARAIVTKALMEIGGDPARTRLHATRGLRDAA